MDNVKLKQLLGKRILELRLSRGMTQQQIAEKMNIDQRTFSRIENGMNFPLRNLTNLAEALQVDLTELFNFHHLDLNINDMKNIIKNEIDKLKDEDVVIIYKLLNSLYK